jgi:outer membrane protein
MKSFGITLFFALIISVAGAQDTKQKFGHINTGNLIELLPEIKQADSLLTAYQDSLLITENALTTDFEKDYTEFVQLANAGELTKIAMQNKQQEFQKREEEIVNLRRANQLAILQKRQELMNPVLEKLQTAVNEVAKENGYSYIFDIGSGSLLFANESHDLEALVKQKLGLQ